MFYDKSASEGQPLSLYRLAMSVATIVLVPPFILLAIAPMVLFLVPVALVAIPIMIPALFPSARSAQFEWKRPPVWQSAFAMQFQQAQR